MIEEGDARTSEACPWHWDKLVCPCRGNEMSQVRRKTIRHFNDPGHAHFLTFSCYRRFPLLNSDRTRRWLIEAIETARRKHNFAVLAYVVMPEHAHLVILALVQHYDVALVLKAIKQPVARRAKRFLEDQDSTWLQRLTIVRGSRTVFRFWQTGPGYDRNVKNESDLWEKIRYIHDNPVKRGLVLTPEAWEWSSARWWHGQTSLSVDKMGGIDKLFDP